MDRHELDGDFKFVETTRLNCNSTYEKENGVEE
jgi:hypothetical protein